MHFKSVYCENRTQQEDDLAFVFGGQNMLVDSGSVPTVSETAGFLSGYGINPVSDGYLFGEIAGKACYAYNMPDDFDSENTDVELSMGPGVHKFVLLRRYVGELENSINSAAGYASHLLHWHRHSLYCGCCGTENDWYEKECAKKCPACGNLQFPKISPAIIIMVRKSNEILLAHNRRFPEGRYSLLAGFMEIGETVEQTAAREVREEVGIEIENVRYISSQSWPFPDSLMLGLQADYRYGELKPDGIEITEAGWYNPGNYPSIPGHGTIARRIIDEYTKTYQS